MSNTAALAIASAASGGFALLGVALGNWLTTRRERTAFRTQTALELPSTERAIWSEDYTELEVLLRRLEASLAVASVPSDLVQALIRISRACWHDGRESRESGDEYGGIAVRLLDTNRLVLHAVRSYLLNEPRGEQRKKLHRQAIARMDEELEDWVDPAWY